MNKKALTIASVTCLALGGTVAAVAINKVGTINQTRASEEARTITIDLADNKLTDSHEVEESSTIVKTDQLKNDITIDYKLCLDDDDNYRFYQDYYIANAATSPIGSIQSVQVISTGYMWGEFQVGYSTTGGVVNYEKTFGGNCYGSSTFTFENTLPNYFRFYAKSYYDGLQKIIITYNTNCELHESPFYRDPLTNIDYFLDDDGIAHVCDGNKATGEVSILSEIKIGGVTYPVKVIDTEAFDRNNKITKVVIPESITNIKSYAFYYCQNLAYANIPSNVVEIGQYSFIGCDIQNAIHIPATVTTLGALAFSDNKNLKEFTLAEDLNIILSNGVIRSTAVETIYLPKKVRANSYTFSSTPKLESITVHPDNESIACVDGVMFNKNKTTLICYPCNRPNTSYEIPEGTVSMDLYSMNDNENLVSLTLPTTLTSVGDYNLMDLTSLTTFIDNSSRKYSGAYELDHSALTSISFNDTIKNVGFHFMRGNKALTSIDLTGASLTELREGAFEGCTNVPYVVVPSTITTIGKEAFLDWTSSQNIFLEATEKLSGYNDNFGGDANKYYYSETEQTGCWHYVSNVPTLW